MDAIRPYEYINATPPIKVEEPVVKSKPTTKTVVEEEKKEENNKPFGIDFSYFTSGNQATIKLDTNEDSSPAPTKKRTRKTSTKKLSDGSEVVLANEEKSNNDTDVNYRNTYKETDNMLKTSIMQIDIMNNDIKSDIDAIRSSKTLKNKYNYITDMTSTSGTLLGTKITAIRELNATIKTCHELELKRMKDIKMAQMDNQDDDRRMMDMYSAFINTPIGNYSMGPNSIDLTTGNNLVAGGDIGAMVKADINYSNDPGYNNYLSTMNPVQNAMRMENDPNITTVVKYNSETGQRWFDVINKTTGESIPNLPRPDEFLLENLHINVAGGFCRDTQLDRTYPLVVIGDNNSLSQY